RLLRPLDPDHGSARELPRRVVELARRLSVEHRSAHERDHATPDVDLDDLHSVDVRRRTLRHELRESAEPVGDAGALVVLRLYVGLARDARDRRRDDLVLPQARLAVAAHRSPTRGAGRISAIVKAP